EGDDGVLHDAQGNLVYQFGGREPRGVVGDDESLDPAVGDVFGPDNREVAEGGVADPFLLPVENPRIPVLASRRRQAAGGAGTDVGPRQTDPPDLVEAAHVRQILLLLSLAAGHGPLRQDR